MTEPFFSDDTETSPHPRTSEPPAMPFWVKVSLLLVGLVGLVLLAVAAVSGGGGMAGHGPGMHGGLGQLEKPGPGAAAAADR